MRTIYTTWDDAILREIVEPIEGGEATADEFDLEAIAEEVLEWYEARDEKGNILVNDCGYRLRDEANDQFFWDATVRHLR